MCRSLSSCAWRWACLFLAAGYQKWSDPLFAARFDAQLAGWAAYHPLFFYQDLIQGVLLPHAEWVAVSVAIAEMVIGVGYLLGLMTRGCGWLQVFLNLNYLLAMQHTHPAHGLSNLTFMVLGLLLIWGEAGQHLGLDTLISRYTGVPPKKRRRTRSAKGARGQRAVSSSRKAAAPRQRERELLDDTLETLNASAYSNDDDDDD